MWYFQENNTALGTLLFEMDFTPTFSHEELTTCHICEKEFLFKQGLKKHFEIEHEQLMRYQCNLCDKTFKIERSLECHLMNYHGGKRKSRCEKCNKDYSTEAHLKFHNDSVHQQSIKEFKCTL